MVAIVQSDNGGDKWDDILGRVLGGINGAVNPGPVTIGGSTPTVSDPGNSGTTDYMPLLLIALVVVVIVVLSKQS